MKQRLRLAKITIFFGSALTIYRILSIYRKTQDLKSWERPVGAYDWFGVCLAVAVIIMGIISTIILVKKKKDEPELFH